MNEISRSISPERSQSPVVVLLVLMATPTACLVFWQSNFSWDKSVFWISEALLFISAINNSIKYFFIDCCIQTVRLFIQ